MKSSLIYTLRRTMHRTMYWTLCWLAAPWFITASNAIAQTQQTSPNWQAGTGVVLQTLDKITARIESLELVVDQPARFGTLDITLRHCAYRPPEEPPEHAAFLEIRDLGYVNADPEIVFSGWMFASSPAVSGLEHAVYDVSVTACIKD